MDMAPPYPVAPSVPVEQGAYRSNFPVPIARNSMSLLSPGLAPRHVSVGGVTRAEVFDGPSRAGRQFLMGGTFGIPTYSQRIGLVEGARHAVLTGMIPATTMHTLT